MSSIYAEFEQVDEELLVPVLRKLLASGLQVCVVICHWQIPRSVQRWVVEIDNTFHDGMTDGVGEWFTVFIRLWPLWLVERKQKGWVNIKTPQHQTEMRNGMAAFFIANMVHGHPLQTLCTVWRYINSQIQVMKQLAPDFFAGQDEDTEEEGTVIETAGSASFDADSVEGHGGDVVSGDLALLYRFKTFWDNFVDSAQS